jgi:hypothetical protein
MTAPKSGDVVKVTLTGEVTESTMPVEGWVRIRVPGMCSIQVPAKWVSIVHPKEDDNGHG